MHIHRKSDDYIRNGANLMNTSSGIECHIPLIPAATNTCGCQRNVVHETQILGANKMELNATAIKQE